MKKPILTLLLIVICIAINADPIPFGPPDIGDVGMPHKAPTILPTADYTDGVLSIQSTFPLSDVTVIIRDAEGTLLYTYYIYSVTGIYDLSLPSSILNDMYSVELLYGSIHLIGYF
ncbi:MAG: DUF3244 domain-containing protein [Prevotella sp.]|nr:DUF3244 domain-containing protein [Prevotella sp.]